MGKVTLPKGFDPKVVRHWYLLANRVEARIYEGPLNQDFHYLKKLTNASGGQHDSELGQDRPGRKASSARGGMRHSLEPRSSPREAGARKFAAEIASLLDEGVAHSEFSDLIIMAEPGFLGTLNRVLSKGVRSRLRKELPKEWKRGSDRELLEFLKEQVAGA